MVKWVTFNKILIIELIDIKCIAIDIFLLFLSISNNYLINISIQSYYYQFINNLGAFKGYELQGNNAE